MGFKVLTFILLFVFSSTAFFAQSSMKNVSKKTIPNNKSNIVTSAQAKKELIENAGSKVKAFMNKNGLKVSPVSSVQSNLGLDAFDNASLNLAEDYFDIERIFLDETFGTPRFIKVASHAKSKMKNSVTKNDKIKTATDFLNNKKGILKINKPDEEFEVKNYQEDKLGKTHIKYKQIHEGLMVWGHEIIVHLDRFGDVESATGRIKTSLTGGFDLNESVSKTSSIEIAKYDLANTEELIPIDEKLKTMMEYDGPDAEKIIWYDEEGNAHLVWHVQIRSGLMHNWQYFVSAKSGKILDSYDNVCNNGPVVGTGYDLKGNERTFGTYEVDGIYHLMDASQDMFNLEKSVIPETPFGVIATYNWQVEGDVHFSYFTSEDNIWRDSSAVSAHRNMIDTYEYLYNVFGRNSYDDNGASIRSFVHYTENGRAVDNAGWNGRFLIFGDGANNFSPIAEAIDAAAHELAHGVINFSANLLYQNQSGALNESFADVFGALLDSTDWQVGEEVVLPGVYPNNAMRDMSDPHNGASEFGERGWQPATMSEFIVTTFDKGGVHINSGIPNKAFYHAAEELGRRKAGKIWYRALNSYLIQLSQFVDARIATVQAAEDLHGENSPEVHAVKSAWDMVEIYEGPGTPPPPTSTLEGEEYILFVNTKEQDFNSLYMADTVAVPALQSLSTTSVSNRPAVSDTSGLVLFIDGENNLRALLADVTDPHEEIIDSSGVWSSVAIGPGLSSIALTSIYIDTTIYYFNLNTEEAKTFKVTNSTSEEVGLQTALFADALSFDPTGSLLLMDSYNEITNPQGDKISFWTLNVLNVKEGTTRNVFPPEEGFNLGNPSFSKISSTRFTFDVWHTDTKENIVWAVDLQSRIKAKVSPPDTVLGYPSYSRNDRTIIYRRSNNGADYLLKIPLENDMVTGIGYKSELYHEGGIYPVWFVIGSRITGVDDKSDDLVKEYSLEQNYPNPFNPTTTIGYSIPKISEVSIKVFDVLGREIVELVNEKQAEGFYEVSFDASNFSSGVYFYTLKAGNNIKSKKMLLIK